MSGQKTEKISMLQRDRAQKGRGRRRRRKKAKVSTGKKKLVIRP